MLLVGHYRKKPNDRMRAHCPTFWANPLILRLYFVPSMTAPVASGWSELAGWGFHPLESAAFARRTSKADWRAVSGHTRWPLDSGISETEALWRAYENSADGEFIQADSMKASEARYCLFLGSAAT